MVTTNVHAKRFWRLPWFRALFVLDLAGLVLVVFAASQMLPADSGSLLTLLSFSIGLTMWLALRPRSLMLPHNRFIRGMAAPLFGAILTLATLAAFREYYSGRYLAAYVVGWTAWMLLTRVTFKLLQPRPRVLLVGASPYWRELAQRPEIATTQADRHPEGVQGWDAIVLDPTAAYDRSWLTWLAHADMANVNIISAPTLVESLAGRISMDALEGRWASSVFHGATMYHPFKRILDVVTVVVLSPLILLLAGVVSLVVLVNTGRPVLFWQERIGRHSRPFRMVKFRTMRADAESAGAAFASESDPRTTRTGALMRKYRLDEIPQFWNVLRGDMSIIGPRPEQTAFLDEFRRTIPLYDLRHNVRPGITGWAQVHQGYAAGTDATREKLRYDFFYVKNLSFWLDLRIVARTLWTIVTGFGSR